MSDRVAEAVLLKRVFVYEVRALYREVWFS